MTAPVGKRESGLDLNPFVDLPPKKEEPNKLPHIDGMGDRAAIEKALGDQGAAEYVARPKRPEQMLADAFAKKNESRGPRCYTPRRAQPDMTGDYRNIAEHQRLASKFASLEAKHTKLASRLEKSVRDWQAAAKTIARTEKNLVARQQKVAVANDMAARAKAQLRETRIQFGIVAHEYKVALGEEKRVAIGPAKPGDRMLSLDELKILEKRSTSFEQRIGTLSESGLIAPVGAFLYVVLTEASGRSLDARDYRALDLMYEVGKLGNSAMEVPGKAREAEYEFAPARQTIDAGVAMDARVPVEARSR